MRTTFDQLLRDVEDFDDKLSAPREFFLDRARPYHQTARAIARRILLPAIPEGHDKERWKHKVERACDRITAELLVYGGLLLTIFEEDDSSGSVAPKGQRPGSQVITHKDAVEWIRAGLAGAPGGKRITDRDRKILAEGGEKALATIIMRAYYSHEPLGSYVRLRKVIQKYLHGTKETTSSALLDGVAAAWVEHFTPRLHRDMKGYIAKLCREF